MKLHTTPNFHYKEQEIMEILEKFENFRAPLISGGRNTIKLFEFEDILLNIKSFKIPNAINKFVYRFIRKSKAHRSFEYAQQLLSRGIGTPTPIAYAEETNSFNFLTSYYISEQQDYDLTFRELNLEIEGHEEILRAFTRFTYKLHENKVEFLDHSPGNTLIKFTENKPEFFLVDLNRMNFRNLDFEARMKNFSRLTPKMEMIKIMASEYAKLIDKPEAEVFTRMWCYTNKFQEQFMRKRRLKKKLKLR